MVLVEDCKLRLDDSIEPWLPELANRRVLKSIASKLDETVPALRAITVRDLLTYRMGFGSVMAIPNTYPIQKLIREYRIGGDGPTLPSQSPGMDEWLRRLGSLPLLAQPGERWMYHVSGDVLGSLIARVSGQSLGAFMRDRIFDPLGMKDTAFHVPPENVGRLPGMYFFDHKAKQLALSDDAANSAWRTEPLSESGGGGLVSTIDDYFAFSRMMLNKGRHGREQILSPRHGGVDGFRSTHARTARRFRNLFRHAFQLGFRNGGGHRAQRDLSHPRQVRLDRRLRHHCLY
jgi:CubicO group peptidase (beta-lactamase class C family)